MYVYQKMYCLSVPSCPSRRRRGRPLSVRPFHLPVVQAVVVVARPQSVRPVVRPVVVVRALPVRPVVRLNYGLQNVA